MKRFAALVIPAICLMVLAWIQPAQSVGTQDNWSVKLTFFTQNSQDLLPITVGAGSTEKETMKPPPMPGTAVTSNPEDAIVNAYIKSAGKKAAESVEQADASLPGLVWPVEVNVEEAGAAVFVTADLSEFFDTYQLSIVDIENNTRVPIVSNNAPVQVFTNGATAGVKTVYVMAGTSKSLAAADSGKIQGGLNVPGRSAGKLGNLNILVKGTGKTATTNADGFFVIDGISPGSYTIRTDGPHLLASEGTLTINADGTAAVVLADALPGDVNEDTVCDVADFVLMKKCYGKEQGEDACTQASDITNADFNLDGTVDVADFVLMKKAYGKEEPAQ